jgi:hypothetical protein
LEPALSISAYTNTPGNHHTGENKNKYPDNVRCTVYGFIIYYMNDKIDKQASRKDIRKMIAIIHAMSEP